MQITSTNGNTSRSNNDNKILKYICSYIKYKFDNLFAHGLIFIIPLLTIISVFIILIFSIIYYYTEETDDYEDALWQTFTRILDPCAAAEDEGLKNRIISGIVILCGLVIVAVLIGTIVTFMDEKLNELRKGRTTVIEKNHTIILGWSPKIFDIINELIIANENQRNPSIVILTSKDNSEVQYMIKDKINNSRNTRIIYRNGNPMSINSLNKLSLNQARSIIILAPEINNPDVRMIKTILAIRNNPRRNNINFHIVAEIKERINLEAAMIAGGDEALFVYADEIIARIIAQSCRQSGLSIILTTLLSFQNDEIYFKHESALIGRTFYDAVFSYNKCSVIGLMLSDGTVKIFPRLNTIINIDDQIIVIAEDDDKIILSSDYWLRINNAYSGSTSSSLINHNTVLLSNPMTKRATKRIEQNLLLGWNNKAPLIAKELDTYVARGSELHILTNSDTITQFINEQLVNELTEQKIFVHSGSLTNKFDLEKLNLFSYDYVMLLANEESEQQNLIEEADAECLICLLYLQNIIDKSNNEKTFSIVAEMYDIRNCQLANTTCADDFIVSPNLISKYISQLSENKNIKKVYDVLLTADGPEIYLCLASMFVPLETPISYYQILQETLKYQCLAIGYRLMKYLHDETRFFGIVLNPDKEEQIIFSQNDKIIILAENFIKKNTISKYLLKRLMPYTVTPTPSLTLPVTNSISLTASDINSYRENGYHVVPDLLSPSQLEQWRTIIFGAVKDRAERKYKLPTVNEEDHTNVDFDYYDNVFTQRINLWQTHNSVKELLLQSGNVIGKIAAELEGIDCVRIWCDQALIKEPFANPTSWHFDVTYWSFTSLHAISVWIALDDSTLENGCMYFMPGSHKVVERRYYESNNTFPEIKIGKNMADIFAIYPELKQMPTVAVPMKAGSASFHSSLLIHGANANMTPGRRPAMTIQMMPDNMVFNGKQNILTKEQMNKLEIGVSVFNDDNCNPILYKKIK
ncbi:unnamed protein product [Rotaria sp. Silwood1]|nr:unnamed protein product [Rotaria sp. Silwood1]CAF1584462.1 unnamed protein product [Rotaria sp. Silwood1]CAF4750127.1 unnamed protein product [Rotaria sp. Silwood1]